MVGLPFFFSDLTPTHRPRQLEAIMPTTHNILEIDAIRTTQSWSGVTCNGTPFTLQTAVDRGITWLLAQTLSTVLDTALVYPVLYALRFTDPATSAALNYLLNSQSADGSWNGDPG